jgi:plastocyanin
MLRRRNILIAGAAVLAGLLWPGSRGNSSTQVVEIHMRSDAAGAHVGFDPIGILIEPGQTVRWICDGNVHTTAAYHPNNDNHSLRIPNAAQPWASDYLQPGEIFEVRLTVEGVYDYFCLPHEMAGMVGRIIVGKPGGPGALPYDYFVVTGHQWMPVPPEAQTAFPSIDEIMQKRLVRSRQIFS